MALQLTEGAQFIAADWMGRRLAILYAPNVQGGRAIMNLVRVDYSRARVWASYMLGHSRSPSCTNGGNSIEAQMATRDFSGASPLTVTLSSFTNPMLLLVGVFRPLSWVSSCASETGRSNKHCCV